MPVFPFILYKATRSAPKGDTTPSYALDEDSVVSPFGADLVALYNINGNTGTIAYAVTGTAPQREFVVEWSHFSPYSWNAPSEANHHNWNFQARLKEDGTIRYVYNFAATGAPSSTNGKVGLRGTTNTDYTNRTASGNATSNWGNNVAGSFSSAGIATNYSFLPAQGLTLTWTPPVACLAPTAQPTALTLTNTGIIINASFTAANPAPDRYLVLRNIAGTTPNAPVTGTTYTTGQNNSLNSYVAYYGTATTFENNYNHGIRGNNQYVYTIYAVNANCTGGPVYNTTAPLTGSITNCPATVNGITTNAVTSTGFALVWPATENGTANTFNTVLEVATNATFTNMVQGSPFTLSSTTLTQAINGLQPNTQYFYRAKNVATQCESAYSSVGSIYTACVPVAAFYEGFDGVTGTALPNCWNKILTGTGGTPSINVTTTDNFSAPNNVSFYGNGADTDAPGTKIILVSPEVTNLAAGTHRLRFKARKTTASNPISINVVALDGTTENANITVVQTITDLTTTYQEFNVYFTNYTGNGTHVGIQRVGGSSYSYMYVDDVIWEAIPTCPELQSVTANATAVGATVSWANPGGTVPQGGYEYFVSATNTPPAETETFIQTTQTTVNITGLANGTYNVFVRRICSDTDKSPWKPVTFTTIPTTPAPWQEEFLTSNYPAGWVTTNWSLGATRGITGNGNSATSLYKNLYGTAATGTFNTIAVGPLNAPDYELSFYYKVSDFNSPYATPAEWGNFTVAVSTDFGATWTDLETITNQAGQGVYTQKTYSLSAYQGEYVKVRITANRTAGDYDLSFDNFEIKAPAIAVESVAVTVADNAPATITEEHGTLQLVATVNPAGANQEVTWSITSGADYATVNENGVVTALANGTVTVRATSVADATKFGMINVVINTDNCTALTELYENFDDLACCDMGVVPTCWNSILLGGASQIISSTQPASGTSQIYQTGYGDGKISVVVLPQFSNVNAGTHQFRFKVKANSGPGQLDFGYVTNANNASTFVLLQSLTISNNSYNSTDAERVLTVPATVPADARLAIRNPGTTWAGMYWDDVYWEPIPVTAVQVTTEDNVAAEITIENGTLQLVATVNPASANQEVTWSITSGSDFATVDENGLVTAVANGTVTVRATSVADDTKFDEIEISVNIEEGYCTPSAGIAVLTTNVQFANINNSSSTTANEVYEDFTDVVANVTKNETYTLTAQSAGFLGMTNFLYLHVYADWNQNNIFEENEFYINTTAGTFNKEILIPQDALTGNTRMRVMIQEGTAYSPCATSVYGQTEDYTLNIAEAAPVTVTDVVVSTENNVAAEITTENGTLQLVATVNPEGVSQEVDWAVASGTGFVSVNENGLVTAITNGTATVRATSVEDDTKFDEIEITVAIEEVPAGYCEAGVDYDVEPISLVNFANVNNATSAVVNATPAYEDFTAMVANVSKGQAYTLTVKGNTAGEFTHDIRVFIDWNQDMVFDMATEYYTVPLTPSTGTDNVEATLQITIPQNALLGNTRMRITKDMWNVYEEGEFDACTNAYYGQVEDYTVNINEAPVVTSVEVATADNVPAQINTENGTLQLVAVVNPTGVNQGVTWSIVAGGDFATVNENGLVTAVSNGTVTVRATSVEDPEKFDDIEIVIDQVAGVTTPEKAFFAIYPNPGVDIVNVSSNQVISQITVYNELGQLVLTVNNSPTINVSNIATGVYIVKTQFENGATATQKLMKK